MKSCILRNNYCKTAIINEFGHKCWCDGNDNDVISMTKNVHI